MDVEDIEAIEQEGVDERARFVRRHVNLVEEVLGELSYLAREIRGDTRLLSPLLGLETLETIRCLVQAIRYQVDHPRA